MNANATIPERILLGHCSCSQAFRRGILTLRDLAEDQPFSFMVPPVTPDLEADLAQLLDLTRDREQGELSLNDWGTLYRYSQLKMDGRLKCGLTAGLLLAGQDTDPLLPTFYEEQKPGIVYAGGLDGILEDAPDEGAGTDPDIDTARRAGIVPDSLLGTDPGIDLASRADIAPGSLLGTDPGIDLASRADIVPDSLLGTDPGIDLASRADIAPDSRTKTRSGGSSSGSSDIGPETVPARVLWTPPSQALTDHWSTPSIFAAVPLLKRLGVTRLELCAQPLPFPEEGPGLPVTLIGEAVVSVFPCSGHCQTCREAGLKHEDPEHKHEDPEHKDPEHKDPKHKDPMPRRNTEPCLKRGHSVLRRYRNLYLASLPGHFRPWIDRTISLG